MEWLLHLKLESLCLHRSRLAADVSLMGVAEATATERQPTGHADGFLDSIPDVGIAPVAVDVQPPHLPMAADSSVGGPGFIDVAPVVLGLRRWTVVSDAPDVLVRSAPHGSVSGLMPSSASFLGFLRGDFIELWHEQLDARVTVQQRFVRQCDAADDRHVVVEAPQVQVERFPSQCLPALWFI